jgi:hypothetical protein
MQFLLGEKMRMGGQGMVTGKVEGRSGHGDTWENRGEVKGWVWLSSEREGQRIGKGKSSREEAMVKGQEKLRGGQGMGTGKVDVRQEKK